VVRLMLMPYCTVRLSTVLQSSRHVFHFVSNTILYIITSGFVYPAYFLAVDVIELKENGPVYNM